MNFQSILDHLPYSEPFLFVDQLIEANDEGIKGTYTFPTHLPFFRGHFKGNPVTPGAILTECCAQIGVVCLGIYLLEGQFNQNTKIALTSAEMEYLAPVFPEEKVTVESKKIYFRFNKLKCKVQMRNQKEDLVCHGTIAGILRTDHGK